MPLFLKHIEDNYQWGVWKIDECMEELLSMIPDQKREEYKREIQHFASINRRLEWLSVRILLYILLGEEKKIMYCTNGKPYLSDYSYHISISHTRGYAVIILSSVTEVSIDIEQYGERIRRVAHKFMHDDEQPSIYFNSDVWSLLLHWSAKEVMFKCCMNTTFIDFRKHFRIYPFQIQEEGIFQAKEYYTIKQQNFLIHYLIRPEFVITWQVTE
jgi:phosphopantetheinyl transferase (holo-ACP synthase)